MAGIGVCVVNVDATGRAFGFRLRMGVWAHSDPPGDFVVKIDCRYDTVFNGFLDSAHDSNNMAMVNLWLSPPQSGICQDFSGSGITGLWIGLSVEISSG